jgi:cell division transport system permease protein
MIRLLRNDLPLAGDVSARFLPWIIGCMVYLAALATTAAMLADKLGARWHGELAGSFSVQIPPPEGDAAAREAALKRVVELVSGTAGVTSARVVSDEEKARLLEPWLGQAGLPEEVRLPDLIIVRSASDVRIDLAGLGRAVAGVVPGATIEDHAAWQSDVVAFAQSIKLLAAIVIGLIAAAAVTTVIFVTKTGLAIHRRVIEIVHLVGAQDSYIARQFLANACRLGLVGGIGGVALAALTLVGLERILGPGATALLPGLSLDTGQWAVLAILPLAVSAVAMITAHLTVLLALARGL